jgi:hypothetical protein
VSLGSALIGTPSKKANKKRIKQMNSALASVIDPVVVSDMESKLKIQPSSVSIKRENSEEDRMELITLEESALVDKGMSVQIKVQPLEEPENYADTEQQLLTDDDSLTACVTPPKPGTRPLLKRPSRAIQSALSAGKVILSSKRVKGIEHCTPSFSSSRVTRSKARIQSSPSSGMSSVKSHSARASKAEGPILFIKKGMGMSKSTESIQSNSVDSVRMGSQTSSAAKTKKVSRLLTTPNCKLMAPKPKVTESAQKRNQVEEERRLAGLREKLDREQRAKEKKMDYLNKKVMEQKNKREEREKKVAIVKRKNEEKKLELEKKKIEKEDLRKKEVEEWKQKDIQYKKTKSTKPWCSSESVRKEDRIQLLNKKQEEIEQKSKQGIKVPAKVETVASEDKSLMPSTVISNNENVANAVVLNTTYKTVEHP